MGWLELGRDEVAELLHGDFSEGAVEGLVGVHPRGGGSGEKKMGGASSGIARRVGGVRLGRV